MRILQINTVYNRGSTGKIAKALHDKCIENGHQCISAYRYREGAWDDTLTVSSWLDCHIHNRLARYTMLQGFFSRFMTRRFLEKVERYSPDVIHLHNLHGSYINLKSLFSYIKKHNVAVVWTLHDCWAFTGHCAYFTLAGCDKWREGCHQCPQLRQIPKSYLDTTKSMYKKKKKMFSSVENMTIVTPSQWLADLVKESFLKNYPVQVIHNGIDLGIFKPTPSDFRQKYNFSESKKIILGVAFGWGQRKGLDVFIDLSKRLDEDKYQIVLVGTDDNVDMQLPSNITSIHRTHDQAELAEIYTAADLFVNPTREENYPTVNMEAIACGTPVLTFRTGGSPEILDETCGSVVECDDIDAMEREIIRICDEKPYSVEACINRSKQFDMNDRFEEYVKLYEKIGNQDCSISL